MDLAKQAPVLVILLGFVTISFIYMERRDTMWIEMMKRDEAVSTIRIEQCHSVQDRSNEALDAVTEALKLHAVAFEGLSIRLQATLDRQNAR